MKVPTRISRSRTKSGTSDSSTFASSARASSTSALSGSVFALMRASRMILRKCFRSRSLRSKVTRRGTGPPTGPEEGPVVAADHAAVTGRRNGLRGEVSPAAPPGQGVGRLCRPVPTCPRQRGRGATERRRGDRIRGERRLGTLGRGRAFGSRQAGGEAAERCAVPRDAGRRAREAASRGRPPRGPTRSPPRSRRTSPSARSASASRAHSSARSSRLPARRRAAAIAGRSASVAPAAWSERARPSQPSARSGRRRA